KKLRKTFEKLTETTEKLHEIILTRPNLPDISFRKEVPRKEVKPIYHNECNFGNKDHLALNDDTLFVRGFDTSLPRHEIKSALWKHFSSCGKVTTVYVPIECATGASLGYAFINLKDHTKGFTLSGSLLGGRKLHVMMAKYRDEFGGYSNFRGCQRCRNYQPWLVHRAIADSLLEKYRWYTNKIFFLNNKVCRLTSPLLIRGYFFLLLIM
ncbi:PREDICTED: uncharacterized protein LOC104753817, partial [Camelina sativa]|uniref:Uncharacterized protein LOC104753817 n=1 Tax=Camelina sativa TaxID=90675 RepID=A0ABM1R3A8_CAMSA